MSTQDEYPDVLTSHSYDGIQEYDNPMPFWWKAIFVLSIVWSGFYVVAIEFGYINKYKGNLNEEAEAIAAVRAKVQDERPPVTDEVLLAAVDNPEMLAQGQKHYTSTCASCHGQNGEGLIGPNLTDKFWLHGGGAMDVWQVVDKGVTAKGMPAWGPILGHDGTVAVSAYVVSLRNTNVAGGKAPQGEVWGDDAVEDLEGEPTDPPEGLTEGDPGLDRAEPAEVKEAPAEGAQ